MNHEGTRECVWATKARQPCSLSVAGRKQLRLRMVVELKHNRTLQTKVYWRDKGQAGPQVPQSKGRRRWYYEVFEDLECDARDIGDGRLGAGKPLQWWAMRCEQGLRLRSQHATRLLPTANYVQTGRVSPDLPVGAHLPTPMPEALQLRQLL